MTYSVHTYYMFKEFIDSTNDLIYNLFSNTGCHLTEKKVHVIISTAYQI